MSEYNYINVAELIEPISEEAPTGTNLREDSNPTSLYYHLKDVRSQARNNERKALEDASEDARNQDSADESVTLRYDTSDWKPILEKAPEILKTQSKDLEVAAWIIEASVRTYGFGGLAEAFILTRELIDRYWDTIHPPEDEDGVETKIAPIIGLNGYGTDGALIMPIKCVPITIGRDYGPYATWEYDQAYKIERITDPEKKQEKINRGALTLEMLKTSVSESNDNDLRQIKKELDTCIEEYAKLTASIDRVCVSNPQPTSNIRNMLEKCLQAMMDIAGSALEEPEEEVELDEEGQEGVEGAASGGTQKAKNKKVDNRKAALESLSEIAAYFRKTEPHSPISYALEQAIRWSNMSLPELMNELVADPGAKDNFFKLTGIRTEQE